MTRLGLVDHLVALVIMGVVPLAALLRRPGRAGPLEEPSSGQKIAGYWLNGLLLALVAGAVLVSWRAGGGSWDALGLTAAPVRSGWGLALTAGVAALFVWDTWFQLRPARIAATRARWRRDTPFMPRTGREVAHSLALVVAAAVAEEILYRGFLISYVGHFAGATAPGRVAAVALPALVFGLSHFYQGGRAVVKIVALSGALGALFVLTGSLWIPMSLHFCIDLVGVLLGPTLLTGAPVEPTENRQEDTTRDRLDG